MTTKPIPYPLAREYTHHGLPVVLIDGQEFAYAADDEAADRAARSEILGCLWAFRSEFLRDFIPCLNNERARSVFDKMRESLCEDANDLVLALIGEAKLDSFVSAAASADGRGHFLASYDGHELDAEGGGFLYRI